MNHMALNIDGGDLDAVIDEMTSLDVVVSERAKRGSVMILDPDRHQIELLPIEAWERSQERVQQASN
jgi:hypothetical protein